MPRVLLFGGLIILHLYVLVDAAMTPRIKNPGKIPRVLWVLFSLSPVLGPAVWLAYKWIYWWESQETVSKSSKNSTNSQPSSWSAKISNIRRQWTSPNPRTSRQKAPDEDEEFLRMLDVRERQRRKEKLQEEGSTNPETSTPSPEKYDPNSASHSGDRERDRNGIYRTSEPPNSLSPKQKGSFPNNDRGEDSEDPSEDPED